MSKNQVDLSKYNNSWFKPGANRLVRTLWYYTNALIFRTHLFPFLSIKPVLLRIFGARIGSGVVIKPGVNIKYPWKLEIGNDAWIGENVWIDNLEKVSIGKSSCLSQGAFLLTGNHDFTSATFDLIVKEIRIEDGVWIGASAIVCPGVTCKSHAMLTAGAIASKDLEAYSVYSGAPAVKIKDRNLV